MAPTSNSSTVYSNVKVPLFEGENYDFWAVKMETLFTSLDVLEFVQNEYEETAATEVGESSQQLEELKKKKKITDAGVLGMIQRAISISIFPRIMRENTSKGAWNILQQEFEGDSNSHGDTIDDRRIVDKILINLTEKFDPMMAVIEETKDLSTMYVQGLMGSLRSYEKTLLRHSEKSIKSAFQSKLNIQPNNGENKPPLQNRDESSRGGRFGRGMDRGRNSRGRV
ncbi:uncharacterized protein LOC127104703 [Lathyrus oleraceus]|uniref:uncharacterized protein LOC127104703 n=1 Tax=Pisum sativum TaxID=3888 RepID=UPI0021D3677B|nr:uncharacterized protein LOC127104703 [Pisum sativum]